MDGYPRTAGPPRLGKATGVPSDAPLTSRRNRLAAIAILTVIASIALPCVATATPVQPRFAEETVLEDLTLPTAVSFAPKGDIFIAEKSGLIKEFDGPRDTTPNVVADLRTDVLNFDERGLLGMTIDPGYPRKPFLYALYTRDAPLGGKSPTWGTPGAESDDCPNPPGLTEDGCVASGRLVRLRIAPGKPTRTRVLVDDWCQQFAHSMGDLAFGSTGALYASAGDGAGWHISDFGQDGAPPNPCGDPPAGGGGALTAPKAEGGSLRSQDLLTPSDPVGLDGTVIRVDPATGAALPDNPLANHPDPNARRIVAYGFRNPYRIAIRPGTDELWVGDVGTGYFDEINRLPAAVRNYGWPCFEGPSKQPEFDPLDLDLCEWLYDLQEATGAANTAPWFSYGRHAPVVAGDGCEIGQSAISGLTFDLGKRFPRAYDDALFFADYARECIWVMKAGAHGLPDPATVQPFVLDAGTAVDLERGPGGLYYVDLAEGALRRIRYAGNNQPPEAVLRASRTHGPLSLRVRFNASASTDPERKRLRYSWDLDGDGRFADSRRRRVTGVYRRPRPLNVAVRVTDRLGERDTDKVEIFPGNTPPRIDVSRPSSELQWTPNEEIQFGASARDREDGALPAGALDWELLVSHCREDGPCHTHPVQRFAGARRGSFTAPAHEYPSFLELLVTATDSDGLAVTRTIRLRQLPPECLLPLPILGLDLLCR